MPDPPQTKPETESIPASGGEPGEREDGTERRRITLLPEPVDQPLGQDGEGPARSTVPDLPSDAGDEETDGYLADPRDTILETTQEQVERIIALEKLASTLDLTDEEIEEADRDSAITFEAGEKILWDVVEEHLDEAEFVYELWQDAISDPDYTLAEVESTLDRRLAAHVDGLLIGGERVAERLLIEALEDDFSPTRALVAALILLKTGDRRHRETLFTLVREAEDDHQRALARAIALSNEPAIDRVARARFEAANDPDLKAIWLDILTYRRVDVGPQLESCLRSQSPPLRRAALEAAGWSGRKELVALVDEHYEVGDLETRRAAMKAGLMIGSPSVWGVCERGAHGVDDHARDALLYVALLGGRSDHHQTLDASLADTRRQEAALWAVGFSGNIGYVETCLSFLESDDERLAKLAAEALSTITGLDLEDDAMHTPVEQEEESEEGAEEEASPTSEGDLEADLVPGAVDELPLLDPGAVRQWWEANRQRFSESTRYLWGEPHTVETLVRALDRAPMRRRHPLGLELAFRTGARWRVTTDAFSSRQRRELRALGSLQRHDLVNFYGLW